jgi:hypothetical protein
MNERASRFLATLAGILVMSAAAAPKDPHPVMANQSKPINDAKTLLGFSSWPGKKGGLKPGFKFVPSSYPALGGFAVAKDTKRVEKVSTENTLLRALFLTRGTEQVRIEIQVATVSTDDAQEALVTKLSMSQADLDRIYVRGDQNGLLVGDLNYTNSVDGAKIRALHFVRNNIRIMLNRSEGSTADLISLGQAIDAQITAEANFTRTTLKTKIPTITTFAPQSAIIPVLSSTPVTLAAADPSGLPLEIQLTASLGQITKDDTVTPPAILFQSDNQTGAVTLGVTVINENLFFALHSATVTIQ